MKKYVALFMAFCMLLSINVTASAEGPDSITFTQSSTLRRFVQDNIELIDNIQPQTAVTQLLTQIDCDADALSVSNQNGALQSNDVVGTGTKISLAVGGNVVDEVTAIIYGDVDGNGDINASDLLSLKRHLLSINLIDGVFAIAANTKKTAAPNASDLLILKRHLLGISSIEQGGALLEIKTIPATNENIRYMGRNQVVGTSVAFDYTLSGFEFNALCEGDVKATITGSGGWYTYGYLLVVVDGVYNADNIITVNRGVTAEYTLASGLKKGVHKIQVYKQTEAQYNTFQLESITIKGEMKPAPAAANLKLEFYGDSITCTEGILGTNISQADSQDAYNGYAAITARNLNADVNCISASSWGLYRGRIAPVADSVIPKIFEYASNWRTPKQSWNFSSYVADVVVVNLGTNDALGRNENPFTDAEYKGAMADFNSKLRAKYPNAHIVWTYNMMTDILNTAIVDAVNDINKTDSKVYAVKLTKNNNGLNGHPDANGHSVAATELTAALKQILNLK